MHYRIPLALAGLLLTSPAFAWDVQCEVDDFTDEESCTISTSQSGNHFGVGLTDDGKDLALSVGDFETLFDDTFLIRVDDQPHRDIEDASFHFTSRNRGFVVAALSKTYGSETIEEAITGDTLNVRLSEFQGANKDLRFNTEGFEEAWNEFRERTGF